MKDLYIILFSFAGVTILLFIVRLFKTKEITMKKVKRGIWGYSIFYTDQKEARREGIVYSKILLSEKHQIQGKPDYIYAKNGGKEMIPIELKSGTIKDGRPHNGDLMQLLSYFLIIEEVYGAKVRQGRLIYKNAMFIIKNTKSMRKLLLMEIKKMRDMLETGEIDVNITQSFVKCKNCIYRTTVCER